MIMVSLHDIMRTQMYDVNVFVRSQIDVFIISSMAKVTTEVFVRTPFVETHDGVNDFIDKR